MRLPALPAVLAAALAASCAYYNGLYNANRLVDEARKAEREGRRSEAQSLWAQAAVKAESVAVRYPESRYYDDALLLQGTALSRMRECREAIDPLRAAIGVSPDGGLRANAALLLGECQLVIGRADSAHALLSTLVDHPDSAIASRARWWRGRAALAAGRPEAALEDLRRTREPAAIFDRAFAHLEAGAARDAAATLDTARHLPFDEARWMPVLDRLGSVEPRSASALADRLSARDDLTFGERARLLIADGLRWEPRDAAYAASRFHAAVGVAGDSLEGRLARAHLAMTEARSTADLERLTVLTEEMGALMLEGGEVVSLLGRFATLLDGILSTVLAPDGDYRDLRMFRVAEVARDSLEAPPLAAHLFLTMARDDPESVIAPKALLAAAELRPGLTDSVHLLLRSDYRDSPYAKAARGEVTDAFIRVEDSIRVLMDRWIGRFPP